jgi:hypothetical protein
MQNFTFPLGGGLDIATPLVAVQDGKAFIAINYELNPILGYRRVKGYERFDGQPSPSEQAIADREAARLLIQRVPGEGPVRGVFCHKNKTYAFRDAVGGLEKFLYVESPMGWMPVTTPVLAPGGFLESVEENFFGGPDTLTIYGVDGKNQPFEFNEGSGYQVIDTGLPTKFPTQIAEFKNHLVLGYSEGSILISVPGQPVNFNGVDGASELAVGDNVVGLTELQGGVLAIFCKDRIQVLSGTSTANFQLDLFSDVGARPRTPRAIFNDAVFLDQQIQRMSSVGNFQNFQAATLSEPVRPIVELLVSNAKFSAVVPSKNQYILFDSSKSALVASFNGGQLSGFTTLSLPHQMSCFARCEDALGRERIFYGSEDGFVYEANKGSSFDGEPIESFLMLAPNHIRSYNQRKRFKKIALEVDAQTETSLLISADFDYGIEPSAIAREVLSGVVPSLFNLAIFNESVFGGELKGYTSTYIEGHGRNIAVFIYHSSTEVETFNLETIDIGYDARGRVR